MKVYDFDEKELRVGAEVRALEDDDEKVVGIVTEITDPDIDEEVGLIAPEVVVAWPGHQGLVSHATEAVGGWYDRGSGDGDPTYFVCEDLALALATARRRRDPQFEELVGWFIGGVSALIVFGLIMGVLILLLGRPI